jgi:hypothetical protein
MEIAVKMAEMSSEGRGRRQRRRWRGDSPPAGIMGERRPLAPFFHGFMGALPHGDGIHGGGKNVALVAANSWVEVVTARKNPHYSNCLLFYFSRQLDVMHHHASITLHVLPKKKINLFLFCLYGITINPLLFIFLIKTTL